MTRDGRGFAIQIKRTSDQESNTPTEIANILVFDMTVSLTNSEYGIQKWEAPKVSILTFRYASFRFYTGTIPTVTENTTQFLRALYADRTPEAGIRGDTRYEPIW